MPCPRVSLCRVDCLHRAMVESYRDARHADVLTAELATGGWPTELAEYRERIGMRTFKSWLRDGGWGPFSRRQPDELEAVDEAPDEDWLDAWEQAAG